MVIRQSWGGGPTPFLPMGKMCLFPFFPIFPHFCSWGKMGKKLCGKRGKSIHFPIFPYTFFPWGKMGKDTFFPWAKMGLDPPPHHTASWSFQFSVTGIESSKKLYTEYIEMLPEFWTKCHIMRNIDAANAKTRI